MFNFETFAAEISRQTVLCVGDLMLDEFVYGDVSRVSPEAPAPVIAVQRSEINVGGSGNVARNIASLGARCIFVGVVGEDVYGKVLKDELAREGRIEAHLIADASRPRARCVSCRINSRRICCAPTGRLQARWRLTSSRR